MGGSEIGSCRRKKEQKIEKMITLLLPYKSKIL